MKKKISDLPKTILVFTTVLGVGALNRNYTAMFLADQGFGHCPATKTPAGWRFNVSVEEAETLAKVSRDRIEKLKAKGFSFEPVTRPVPYDSAELDAKGMGTLPLPEVVTAFEMGYRCCEKGFNLQAALAELHKLFVPEENPICPECKQNIHTGPHKISCTRD